MNVVAIISLTARLLAIAMVTYFSVPGQIREVWRPKDYLTRLRWYILALLVLFIISSFPSLLLQFLRIGGPTGGILSSVASIATNVSILSMAILFVLISKYRQK
jgi:hypothetical protein